MATRKPKNMFQKPSVGFIIPSFTPHGGIRVIFEIANRLAQRGYPITMFDTSGKMFQTQWGEWFSLERGVTAMPLYRDLPRMDAVVFSSPDTLFCFGGKIKNQIYFIQMREAYFLKPSALYSRARAEQSYWTDGVTYVSIAEWITNFLRSEFDREDIVDIPIGVNFDHFYPEEHHFPESGGDRVLIEGIGNNWAKSGWDTPLDILKHHRFEIWGYSQNYPPKDKLKYYSRFFISPSNGMLREIYNACDLLVKTTRYEGSSCAPMEAIACGKPVVVAHEVGTDHLRLDDTVEKFVNFAGWGNTKSIEQAILDGYAGMTNTEGKPIKEAVSYAHKHWDWEDKIDKWEKLINRR